MMQITFDSKNQRVVVADDAGNETIYINAAEWYAAGGKPGSWPKPLDPPTPAQQIEAINREAQQIILAAYPLWYQTNCANGVYPVAVADAMKAGIASVIAESNRCSDLVLAGQPYIAVWPTIGG
jgi:hypothetical protein